MNQNSLSRSSLPLRQNYHLKCSWLAIESMLMYLKLVWFFLSWNFGKSFTMEDTDGSASNNRLKAYKYKGRDTELMRRGREEEGVQLRKQKKDQLVCHRFLEWIDTSLFVSVVTFFYGWLFIYRLVSSVFCLTDFQKEKRRRSTWWLSTITRKSGFLKLNS